MEIYEPLELAKKGKPLGRWRMTVRDYANDPNPTGLCKCMGGHESPSAARCCQEALGAIPPDIDRRSESPTPPALPVDENRILRDSVR